MITAPIVAARLRVYTAHTEGEDTRIIRAMQGARLIGRSARGGPPDRAARLDPAETVLLAFALILPPMPLPTLVDRTWGLFRLGSAETSETVGDALVAAMLSTESDIAEIILGTSNGDLYAVMGGMTWGTAPADGAIRHETIIGREAVQAIAAMVQAANED